MNEKTTVHATLEAVSQFTQSLENIFSELDTETRILLTLGVQELLVNIVEHAYAGASGSIEIVLKQSASALQVIVTDQAEATFNIPKGDITAPDPLDLPEGGMGLFIIYQSFDEVKYQRLSNGNQWQLMKNLG